MKRQVRTVSAIVRISLESGDYTYARVLDRPSFAFYNYKSSNPKVSIDSIIEQPILTRLNVAKEAVTTGRWLKIGKSPLEANLSRPVKEYVWNKLNPQAFHYINEEGKFISSNYEECKNFYSSSLLSPALVENILFDYYYGEGDLLKKKYGKGSLKYLVGNLKNG